LLTDDQTAFLLAHRIAYLATVDAAGQPHTLPCCFAVVDGRVYTPLDRKPKRVPVERLRRVRDLQSNPAICLTVDDYDEDWRRLRWLQVRGEAALIQPGAEHQRAIVALRQRYQQYAAMPLEELPVIRIAPKQIVEWAWPAGAD
jgi:coenzyme F420-0:L-glutamate ligase/coenzyme F420-1:gamma-L-glutamate ligase